MGLFDSLKRNKPAAKGELQPQGKCTQLVGVESTLDAANGGVEGWFFTLPDGRQRELLEEMAQRGLTQTHNKYPMQVAIDLTEWPRHCTVYNGKNSEGKRGAGIGFMYFAEPSIVQTAAQDTFNGAAACLHAAYRAGSR